MTNYKTNRILGLIAISLLFFGLFPKNAMAQFDNTLYNMKVVPQTNLYNPAFIPDYKFHFGFPLLSSENVGFGSSGPKYDDAFYKRPDDSLAIDIDGIINAMHGQDVFHFQDLTQILNFGIKINKMYISASVNEIVDINFMYSKDFMELLAYGNAHKLGETIDMNKMSLKALHYREYALGLAYSFNDKLDIGGRIKLLYGKAAIDTKRMDGSIMTNEDNYNIEVKSNLLINASLPNYKKDTNERVTTTEYLMYSGNVGMAIDLGANYTMDKWSFAASVLDLGYINYDRWLKNYSSDNAELTYRGLDAVEFQGLEGDARDKKIKALKDSIIDIFKLKETADAFNVQLSAKIYLSANYQLSKSSNLGILARTDIYRNTWHPSLTLSFTQDLGKHLSVIGSYTMADNSFTNVGFGIAARVSKLQFYLVSDNLLGAFMPEIVKYTNLHFGINFVFPEKKAQKTMMDLEDE